MAQQPPAPNTTTMLTVRLPRELVDELKLVAVQRRVQRKPPTTQAAIIETALRDWLRRTSSSR